MLSQAGGECRRRPSRSPFGDGKIGYGAECAHLQHGIWKNMSHLFLLAEHIPNLLLFFRVVNRGMEDQTIPVRHLALLLLIHPLVRFGRLAGRLPAPS